MPVIQKVRLTIRDQNELLNQIAGTYKDFYRAAMEYVDNAIDAAEAERRGGRKFEPILRVNIETAQKRVSFTDNCGGMTPNELCELLSEVGRSKKKTVAWANGQFGFGVHAFRAFAKEALFISRGQGSEEAKIRIDRAFDETTDVLCERTDGKQLKEPGTRVTICRFDPQVFKRSVFMTNLVSEIEHHFDDVLRAGAIRILVSEDDGRAYDCRFFDFAKLAGTPLKRSIAVKTDQGPKNIEVDLRILEKSQENRLPVLVNKQRRIQAIFDLKSYKQFLRNTGQNNFVWGNPFVVGFVEINDICSPNLTRDDLKDSQGRELLFSQLSAIQKDLEIAVNALMDKKQQDSYKTLSKMMSDCLARILRGFKLQFESYIPGQPNQPGLQWAEDTADLIPPAELGGEQPLAGDKSEEKDRAEGESKPPPENGDQKPGTDQHPPKDQSAGEHGRSPVNSTGPQIEFQNHAGEDRVIDLTASLIINTQHPDFIDRNPNRSGKITLDARLINYVSVVVAPYLVHRLFERKGKVPTALEAGKNIINIATQLEKELNLNLLGEEIEHTK